MNPFTLQIPGDIERQLRQCRSSLRTSIRKRLQEIADGASALPPKRRPSAPKEPPLRFYVFEGCRVSYQLNPLDRTVVVLDLRTEVG
jgi:PHP family Zn ribbon phosphoesterase